MRRFIEKRQAEIGILEMQVTKLETAIKMRRAAIEKAQQQNTPIPHTEMKTFDEAITATEAKTEASSS